MINLNVRKLEDPKELMGGEHVPQHDCHGLQTCKYHGINGETPGSGSHVPPSARAVSPFAFQHHLDEHKPHSSQHSPFSQPAKAPLPRGCLSFHHRGDSGGSEGAQGSHPSWSTDPMSHSQVTLQSPAHPLTSTDTHCSPLDPSCRR